MVTIGERLRLERERTRLNQTAFGELAGVQRNTQANYESDQRTPDAAYLSALIPHGVDVWFVLTGERFPATADTISGPAARLLEIFGALSPEAKTALLGVAEALAVPRP